MFTRILSVAVLLVCVCLSYQLPGNLRHNTKGIVPLCCTEVSSHNVSARITGSYTVQVAKDQCVHAFIFPTKKGKICVDPKAEWVQRFIPKNKE